MPKLTNAVIFVSITVALTIMMTLTLSGVATCCGR
jgi:hypothetical protein